jgi:hypothetical protein
MALHRLHLDIYAPCAKYQNSRNQTRPLYAAVGVALMIGARVDERFKVSPLLRAEMVQRPAHYCENETGTCPQHIN